MALIDRQEMSFGRDNFIWKTISGVLMRVLGINKINRVYESLLEYDREQFTSKFLDKYEITYSVAPKQLNNIPRSGGVIVIANHPSGALDGIVLIDAISKIRSDVKFIGNYLLTRIDPLKSYFIDVDPFNPKSATNINGIRKSMEHIAEGGVLVIFPAGEVSTFQKGFTQLRDKEWSESMMKFIRKSNLPVVPIYIEGKNSKLFHVVGMVHPLLRTAMLPHELLNKRGTNVELAIGTPLLPVNMSDIKSIKPYTKYLRTNLYLLKESIYDDEQTKEHSSQRSFNEIIAPVDVEELIHEVDSLRLNNLLFNYTTYSVFCALSSVMPNLMVEISRLREMTYRGVGEGTNKSYDSDIYDNYYHQLFIWDNTSNKVIGAYSVGYGEDIVAKYGMNGFYTNSLFKMNDVMIPIMTRTIELGRSFIIQEYQRKALPLMLLWKGILHVLMKNEHYRYLLGPVSISGEMRDSSKLLIVNYIKRRYFDYELAKNIKPIIGLNGLNKYINPVDIDNIPDIECLDKIILDIEHRRFNVPVLIKRYLQLGGNVLGFNIDHDVNDTIDALLILDLTHVPQQTIQMLSKE